MPKIASSGPKCHLLIFKELVEVKSESDGSVTQNWDRTAFTEYAEIVRGKSEEVFESQRRNALATWPQYVASETYIFKINHRDGIDSLKHRILFENKIYGIFPPVRDNRRREMLIQAIFLSTNDAD